MNTDLNQIQNPVAEPPQMTPDQLIQSLNGGAPAGDGAPPAGELDAIGGVPREQFFTALGEFTGGKVNNPDVFNQTLEAAGRAPELENKVRDYEARLAISPWHSDLSKRVDELLREGKAPREVMQFIELSDLKLDTIEPLDAIRRHYTLSKPGFTSEQRDALIQRDLGFDPDSGEDLTPLQQATLLEKKGEATAFLAQQQVSAQNPQAAEAARVQQERNQGVVETWTRVIPTLKSEQKWEFQVNPETKLDFAYQPSAGAAEAARQAVLETVRANPGSFPPTTETAQQLQGMYNQFLVMADFEALSNAMYADAYAKAQQAALQRVSGNGTVLERPNGGQQHIPQSINHGYVPGSLLK